MVTSALAPKSRVAFAMLLGTLVGFSSCTPDEPAPELEITPPQVTEPPASPEVDLASLDRATQGSERLEQAVSDVRHMLEARVHEANGRSEDAVKSWYRALTVAEGDFGARAFEGWVKAYVKAVGKKSDVTVLSKLILAETQGGRASPYLVRKGWLSEQQIATQLRSLVPEWLEEEEAPVVNPDFDAPTEPGIPKDDKRLTALAKKRCQAQEAQRDGWRRWAESLSDDVRTYWIALVNECSGQLDAAMTDYAKTMALLGKSAKTQALAIEAGERLALLQRQNAGRDDAAKTYRDLMALWEDTNLKAADMGLTPDEYYRRRINDALWAARYRALIGDMQSGKIYAQKALDLVSQAYSAIPDLTQKLKEELAELRAEGYHVLAYRIALEQREYESALSLTMLGLQTPHLSAEWQDRLAWFAGLYDYLGGHYDGARRRWEALLVNTKDESLRPMIYFWLAKTYERLSRKAESDFYLKAIIEDYPLSFYAVVAPQKAGLPRVADWWESFKDLRALEERLETRADYDLKALKRSPELQRALMRAEVLVAAKLPEWSRIATRELQRQMEQKLVMANHVGAFVYLSRLQFASGNFLAAISLTTRLAETVHGFWRQWPEQLLVYFPLPYSDLYQRKAIDSGVDSALLYAISRQESAFTVDATSHARARGLMQLIRPTAIRFAAAAGIDPAKLDEALTNPEANVAMGSLYLKELSRRYKGYQPAIYGGYNAGEYAMDAWLERRAHSDPLLFIELIPFGETKGYVKNVWRNFVVYGYLLKGDASVSPGGRVQGSEASGAEPDKTQTISSPYGEPAVERLPGVR